VKELGKIGFLKLYLLEKADKVSELKLEETCYLLGGLGLFMYKSNDLFKSIARCEVPNSCDVLPFIDASKLPKIPKAFLDQAIAFFKKVYDLHKTESALILYWDKTTFKWSCPKQKVSGGSVSYVEEHPGEGWLPILHMHSHASMSAFHSGTDDKDEFYVDGYNITIGKLNDIFEFECRIMLGKAQQKCKLSDIIFEELPEASFPNEWLNNVDAPNHHKVETQLSIFPDVIRGSIGPVPSENVYDGIYLSKDLGGIF